MKYLLLDVSGTILYKPTLFDAMCSALHQFKIEIEIEQLKYHHKTLSELIKFPDKTSLEFYNYFNSELLYSLGIIPNKELLNAIFQSCSYLPWQKYDDCDFLEKIDVPMGILSNFNSKLNDKLNNLFGPLFRDIFVSEKVGLSKPSVEFYQYALDKIEIEANEILYIGDSFKLDFEPAKSLGISTFIIDRDGFYKKNKNVIRSFYELKDIIK